MNKLTRREFLRASSLSAAGAVLSACGVDWDPEKTKLKGDAIRVSAQATSFAQGVDQGRAQVTAALVPSATPIATVSDTRVTTVTPTATFRPTADRPAATATVTATVRSVSSETLRTFDSLGIKVDVDALHPDWPKKPSEAARAISTNGAVKDWQMVPAVEPDGVWRGWWLGEHGFKLKSGVRFDARLGVHVDAVGNPVFRLDQIFNFSAPRSEDLVDVSLNVKYAGLFARRGGVTKNNQPQHSSYFTGVPNTSVSAVEQTTIIPAPNELCPEDWTRAAVTRAYRMAVASFRDNKDAREGFMDGSQRRFVDIWSFNSQTKRWEKLDGRLIARLTMEKGKDALTVIERLAPNWPINPNKVSESIGGFQGKWVFGFNTAEWFFEAFPLLSGVTYVDGVGHVGQNGKLLVGAEQADGARTKVFNFKAQPESMADHMFAPRSLSGVLFVRAGEASSQPELRSTSFYTWGNGDVIARVPAFEQATLMPVGETGCPVSDVETQKLETMRERAKSQPDPKVKAFYWDGTKFVSPK